MKYFLSFLVLLYLTSCATVPNNRVARPWIYVEENPLNKIVPEKFRVVVDLNFDDVVGDLSLTKESIKDSLSRTLIRRGFTLSSNDSKYTIKSFCNISTIIRHNSSIMTKTSSISEVGTDSAVGTGSTVGVGTGSAVGTGLGVFTASFLSALSVVSLSKNENRTSTVMKENDVVQYLYKISVDIYEQEKLVWHGNSNWSSDERFSLNEISYAYKLLFSNLPKAQDFVPRVPLVKKDHFMNFYKLYFGNSFSCPALPFPIYSTLTVDEINYSSSYAGSLSTFDPPEYSAAFLDLIKTAEYALPIGVRKITNPLDYNIWSKVELGGKYYIGSQSNMVYLLVFLEGQSNGYRITKTKVVSKQKYEEFLRKLRKWQDVLIDYYNVYEE